MGKFKADAEAYENPVKTEAAQVMPEGMIYTCTMPRNQAAGAGQLAECGMTLDKPETFPSIP